MIRALLGLSLVVTGGCAIHTDDGPRAIDPATRPELVVPAGAGGSEATGSARIYLVVDDPEGGAAFLAGVARDVAETPEGLLQALFEGPNSLERSNEMRTAIPQATELHDARIRAGLVVVDVSAELQELSSEVLIDAVAQIVLTAAESGVDRVRIEIDGEARQWPGGDGELQSEPLTPYDFPGLLRSAQPAYPPMPRSP